MREFIGQKNQRIRIGSDIVITILNICAGRVRCLLEGPRGTQIIREQQIPPRRGKRPARNQSFRIVAQQLTRQAQ